MMWVFSLSGCHGKRWARTHDDDHVGDDGVAQDGGHTPAYRLTETLLCEQASSEGGKNSAIESVSVFFWNWTSML